ncbi:hypothetical protein HMSSN036_75560 [Paenibacillus macerans]|nr:hypothetical protein HMSSN036_75560 [Paenibacillus macerans]
MVLVGNGMAGMRTIEHVLKLAPEAYEITVFGASLIRTTIGSCCPRCSPGEPI